jgi:hypothetical protein
MLTLSKLERKNIIRKIMYFKMGQNFNLETSRFKPRNKVHKSVPEMDSFNVSFTPCCQKARKEETICRQGDNINLILKKENGKV